MTESVPSVCFWQNMPSHIQAPVLTEFARQWPARTHAFWCEEIHTPRRELGWQGVDVAPMQETTLPPRDFEPIIEKIVAEHRESIHVFSGLHAYAPIIAAFDAAVRRGADRLSLMVESGILWGLKGWVRPARARWLGRRYLPHIRLVLAMGSAGAEFYRQVGFAEDVIYPFLYQSAFGSELSQPQISEPLRLIYVGNFTRRKGVDVLLRALSKIPQTAWHLSLVGDGPEAARLRSECTRLGLEPRITWHGVVSSDEVPSLMSGHDLCIVPSRFDGWGVATNEALCAGVGVICSDRAASSELVRYSGAGAVFPSGDVQGLADELQRFLTSYTLVVQAKQKAAAYRECLEPRGIAAYLAQVLRHRFLDDSQRPRPPWVTPC